jgi:hypothetical protein
MLVVELLFKAAPCLGVVRSVLNLEIQAFGFLSSGMFSASSFEVICSP